MNKILFGIIYWVIMILASLAFMFLAVASFREGQDFLSCLLAFIAVIILLPPPGPGPR